MHFRPFRSLSALTFASALFLGLAPSAAAAGAKDKEAQKLLDGAINDDYLATEYAKAEKKLKDALGKCGASGCSPELLGKIHVALATVYGVGLNKADDAKSEFVAALKADPKAAPSADLVTPELTKIFEAAKKAAGGSAPAPTPTPSKTPTGDASHTPPAESQVNTPVPIYVEPDDSIPLSKVTLRYRPFGAKEFKSVELKKLGKGYGGEIPCEDVTTTGDIKYFFAFTGTDQEPAGGLGTSKEPFKTTVKNELEGDPPKLPGKKAPDQCKEKGDCPPGLPGCEPIKGGGGKRGDKGWGSSCDATPECKEGLACLNGTCAEATGETPPGGDEPKKRMNLIGLAAEFDFLVIQGAKDVCNPVDAAHQGVQQNSNYTCYLQGSSNQFFGSPTGFSNTDGIQGGGSFAGARILVSYERQLLKKIGLTLGLHIGYAFGGPGSPSNVDAMGNGIALDSKGNPIVDGKHSNISPASKFLPLHVEGRASYYIFNSMMDVTKFRPYVFINGGVGQVNASVPVAVCDTRVGAGDAGVRSCPAPAAQPNVVRQVSAYQITGLNFVGFGGGTTFGITPLFGVKAELKFMFMLPTFGVVVAPSVGPVFNF